jgi:heme/copper-type cytochrome/quinol oxidase subunit 3
MSEHAAAPRRAAPVAKPNGWWGMALFVATEATLFGTLFGTWFYLRFESAQWPPRGVPEPSLVVPVVLALVLAATSVPVQLSLRSARAGRVASARRLLLLALLVQVSYFAMQTSLIEDDLAKFTPQESAYGSIYYTLLGAHQAHVALGILLELWLLAKLLRGLTRYRLVALQSTALYWHFVNLLALLVVGAVLSARA